LEAAASAHAGVRFYAQLQWNGVAKKAPLIHSSLRYFLPSLPLPTCSVASPSCPFQPQLADLPRLRRPCTMSCPSKARLIFPAKVRCSSLQLCDAALISQQPSFIAEKAEATALRCPRDSERVATEILRFPRKWHICFAKLGAGRCRMMPGKLQPSVCKCGSSFGLAPATWQSSFTTACAKSLLPLLSSPLGGLARPRRAAERFCLGPQQRHFFICSGDWPAKASEILANPGFRAAFAVVAPMRKRFAEQGFAELLLKTWI